MVLTRGGGGERRPCDAAIDFKSLASHPSTVVHLHSCVAFPLNDTTGGAWFRCQIFPAFINMASPGSVTSFGKGRRRKARVQVDADKINRLRLSIVSREGCDRSAAIQWNLWYGGVCNAKRALALTGAKNGATDYAKRTTRPEGVYGNVKQQQQTNRTNDRTNEQQQRRLRPSSLRIVNQ